MNHNQTPATEWVRELIGGEESRDVEFKESVYGLDAGDIVAFANSPDGGTIFLGVREDSDEKGHQRGYVIGCAIGDKEKLKIINKAQSCIPPIDIRVEEAVVYGKSVYCVHIGSGPDKPYCTGGGTYKIRGDARTNPLTPTRLLNLFLEKESHQFVSRFKEATLELTRSLDGLMAQTKELDHDMDQISARIAQVVEAERDRYQP